MPVFVTDVGFAHIICLNRPEKRNAMNLEMAMALDESIESLESSPTARVGILMGNGPVFCAGTDVTDMRDKRTVRGGEYGLLRRERTKPLIAAVDGLVLGGGFEIVMACDLIVASTRAEFGFPETRRGLVATGGALFRAPRSLPYHVAAEMLLTGRTIDAQRAYSLGLASAVVEPDELEGAALDLAADITRGGPRGTAETLTALRAFAGQDDALGWWMTARAKRAILDDPESAEGRAAFIERRPPSWDVADAPAETNT